MADIAIWQLTDTARKVSKHETSDQWVQAQCNRHITVYDDSLYEYLL